MQKWNCVTEPYSLYGRSPTPSKCFLHFLYQHTHTHTRTHTHHTHTHSSHMVDGLVRQYNFLVHHGMWEELRLYLHTHTNTSWHSDHTSQSHALCTKHLAISQSSVMTSQTYMRTHSQHQCLQSTHPSQSLFHFIQLQVLFTHSILHEEATLVKNILQTHRHSSQ